MRQNLVLSFITNDRPGVVETLAQIVSDHGGNWLESRLSHLAGKFAGIVRISVNEDSQPKLEAALLELNQQDYQLQLEASEAQNISPHTCHQLTVLGLDRPGIVKEISSALAQHGLNVIDCMTDLSSAPMTGEPLFSAQIEFSAADDFSLDDIQIQLDDIAGQLAVEIELAENI